MITTITGDCFNNKETGLLNLTQKFPSLGWKRECLDQKKAWQDQNLQPANIVTFDHKVINSPCTQN